MASVLLGCFGFQWDLAGPDISFLMPLSVAFLETQGLRWLNGGRLRWRVNT
ncbi:MAG: hypothetical protein AB2693_31915 [Candidatus Thiodiazotropha sp.]